MSRKFVYIILIILLLVALGLASLFWYLSRNIKNTPQEINNIQPEQVENNTATETPVIVLRNNNGGLAPLSDEEKEKAQLKKLVSAFIERYGSYSNQTDFENLVDLMSFMSRDLKIWAENLIASKKVNARYQTPYYGVTTKVLKTEIVDFNESIVKIKVSTQKNEMFGTDYNSKVSYEDLTVSLIQEEGVWKVDEVKK